MKNGSKAIRSRHVAGDLSPATAVPRTSTEEPDLDAESQRVAVATDCQAVSCAPVASRLPCNCTRASVAKPTGLAAFARQLSLTRRERRFAEALARDPERNQTNAAIKAGYPENAAHVRGSETVRKRKVQTYMAAVVEEARTQAPQLARQLPEFEPDEAALSTAEVLLRLSRQGRSDIGRHLVIDDAGEGRPRLDLKHTDIVREYQVEEHTIPGDKRRTLVRTKLKVADPVPALLGLARIYGLEDRGADDDEMQRVLRVRAFIVNVVMKDAKARAALSELSRHILEAKAKVVV